MIFFSILSILSVFLNVIVLFLHVKKQRKIEALNAETDKALKELKEDIKALNVQLSGVLQEHVILLKNIQRIHFSLEAITMFTPPCVKSTIMEIISSKEDISLKKANLIFLKYLMEEYIKNVQDLTLRLEASEDSLEKERISTVIHGLNEIITILSTVSEDSSDEYLSQIYKEIYHGAKKIKST